MGTESVVVDQEPKTIVEQLKDDLRAMKEPQPPEKPAETSPDRAETTASDGAQPPKETPPSAPAAGDTTDAPKPETKTPDQPKPLSPEDVAMVRSYGLEPEEVSPKHLKALWKVHSEKQEENRQKRLFASQNKDVSKKYKDLKAKVEGDVRIVGEQADELLKDLPIDKLPKEEQVLLSDPLFRKSVALVMNHMVGKLRQQKEQGDKPAAPDAGNAPQAAAPGAQPPDDDSQQQPDEIVAQAEGIQRAVSKHYPEFEKVYGSQEFATWHKASVEKEIEVSVAPFPQLAAKRAAGKLSHNDAMFLSPSYRRFFSASPADHLELLGTYDRSKQVATETSKREEHAAALDTHGASKQTGPASAASKKKSLADMSPEDIQRLSLDEFKRLNTELRRG
jgi:hypothetical protein